MKFKKVPGERLLAAIIDMIILQVIGIVVMLIPLAIWGFDSVVDYFFTSMVETPATETSSAHILVIITYIGVILNVVWFCIVPWMMNGQTVGKKFMKIKAVNEFGENPSLFQHFVRAVQNWTQYFTGIIIWLVYVDMMVYSIASLLSIVVSMVVFASCIMLLVRLDGRGLHDLMSGTFVVGLDDTGDRSFVEATAQMGDWVEVEDKDDEGFMEEDDKEDDWEF